MAKLQTVKKRVTRKKTKRRVKKSAPVKKTSTARRKALSRKSVPCDPVVALAPVGQADLTSVYRARMQLVGGLLNSAFDQVASTVDGAPEEHCGDVIPTSADASVRRVGQGAYLQVMGQVFAAMFDLSQAIPTDELVKLSKIVAEQRRAETGARKAVIAGGEAVTRTVGKPCVHDSDTSGRSRELPASFGDMVQQIYGVSVTDLAAGGNGPGGAESDSNGNSMRQ